MQYGFLIDHRRCIGCHACTVACKSENDVPVGELPHLGQVHRGRRLPGGQAPLRRAALQPLHQGAVRHDLPGQRAREAPGRHRRPRPRRLHRLPRLHAGLPLRRDLPERGLGRGREVPLLRAPRRAGPRAGVRRRLPRGGDHRRRPARSARAASPGWWPSTRRCCGAPSSRPGPTCTTSARCPSRSSRVAAERPATYIWSERPPSKPEPWPASLETVPNVRTVLDAGHKVQWGWPVALYLVTKGLAAGVALLAPFAAG